MNITFTADPLPLDFKGTLQDFQNRFLLNLKGTISDTQVLIGQVGGSKPTSNIGPWLNGDTWYVWNGSEYIPTTVKVGGAGFTVQLGSYTTVGNSTSNILADKTQLLQDKDGTIALLSDVYVGRPAVLLTGTTPTIDWSQGHHFAQTLTGNTAPRMINSQDGQTIAYSVRNNATSFTMTWTSTPVFWITGTPPAQTASKTDLYIFKNIGGTIFGRQIANY